MIWVVFFCWLCILLPIFGCLCQQFINLCFSVPSCIFYLALYIIDNDPQWKCRKYYVVSNDSVPWTSHIAARLIIRFWEKSSTQRNFWIRFRNMCRRPFFHWKSIQIVLFTKGDVCILPHRTPHVQLVAPGKGHRHLLQNFDDSVTPPVHGGCTLEWIQRFYKELYCCAQAALFYVPSCQIFSGLYLERCKSPTTTWDLKVQFTYEIIFEGGMTDGIFKSSCCIVRSSLAFERRFCDIYDVLGSKDLFKNKP